MGSRGQQRAAEQEQGPCQGFLRPASGKGDPEGAKLRPRSNTQSQPQEEPDWGPEEVDPGSLDEPSRTVREAEGSVNRDSHPSGPRVATQPDVARFFHTSFQNIILIS